MGSKSRVDAAEQDLFRLALVNLIDQRHELVKLAARIDPGNPQMNRPPTKSGGFSTEAFATARMAKPADASPLL